MERVERVLATQEGLQRVDFRFERDGARVLFNAGLRLPATSQTRSCDEERQREAQRAQNSHGQGPAGEAAFPATYLEAQPSECRTYPPTNGHGLAK